MRNHLIAGIILIFLITAVAGQTEYKDGVSIISNPDGTQSATFGIETFHTWDNRILPISDMQSAGSSDYPYLVTEGNTSRSISVVDNGKINTITIPKTVDLIYTPEKVSPKITVPKTALASRMVDFNTTVGYITVPYSLNRLKDRSDDSHISFGRFVFNAGNDHITISDSNGAILNKSYYDFRIVNDEIRLYFIKAEANKLQGSITFQMNSWTLGSGGSSWGTNSSLSGLKQWTDGHLWVDLSVNDYYAYWPFDHNYNDINGNWPLTASGTVSIKTDGTQRFGSGAVSLSSSGYVYSNTNTQPATLGIPTNFAFLASFNTTVDPFATAQFIGGKFTSTNTTAGYGLYARATDDKFYGYPSGSSGAVTNGTSLWSGATNTWHYSGVSQNSTNTILDIDSITNTGATRTIINETAWFSLGIRDKVNFPMTGMLDDVFLFHRGLTQDERNSLYAHTLKSFGNVTVWYDAGSGSEVYRITVNASTPSGTNYTVYYRNNATGDYTSIATGQTGNTTTTISGTKYQNTDVIVQMFSSTPTTPILYAITVDTQTASPSTYIPPDPISLSNSTGNFWIRHDWNPGAGNKTDSYNVSQNGTWHNGSSNTFNTTVPAHGWSNITIRAYNASDSGTLSTGLISMNTQLPNNVPILSPIGNKSATNGTWLNFTILGTDLDSDTLSCGTNATKGNLTGCNFNWSVPDENNTYNWNFNISDIYGGVDDETITVTISNATIANFVNFSFTNKSVSEGAIYQSSQSSVISVDVNDSDGSIVSATAQITFAGVNFNYSMTHISGDTWQYSFKSGLPGQYVVTRFYATDNASGTNSSSWDRAITVVPISAGGVPLSPPGTTPTPTYSRPKIGEKIYGEPTIVDMKEVSEWLRWETILMIIFVASVIMILMGISKRDTKEGVVVAGIVLFAASTFAMGWWM